jgi:hypothetical protein
MPAAASAVTVTQTHPETGPQSLPTPTSGALGSPPNLDASIAAADALSNGKSLDEAVAAAQVAAAGAGNDKAPVAPPADPALSEEDEREAHLRRRWLLALCHFGRGEFERLSTGELLDVAALVDQRALPFEVWRTQRGE